MIKRFLSRLPVRPSLLSSLKPSEMLRFSCYNSYTPMYSFSSENTLPKRVKEQKEQEDDEDISDDEGETTQKRGRKKDADDEPIIDFQEAKILEKENKILFQTNYGIVEIKGSLLPKEKILEVKNIYYLKDSSSANYIKKILKSDPNPILVFEPSSHYVNATGLYNSYRKRLYLQYFGTKKKPRNPFKNCKNNVEIFNLSRRIKVQIKAALTRICIMVNYNGTLRLKGQDTPFSDTMKQLLQGPNVEEQVQKEGFYKVNYLVPVSFWQGIHSSDEWEKAGIPIHVLGEKKIFPLYSVWAPTKQNYLSLFDEYIEDNKNMIKARKHVIDLGSGTGILSILFALKAGLKDITAVDSNPRAVECTKYNAQLLDVSNSINAVEMDFAKLIKEKKTEEFLGNKKLHKKYELILANPPWIVASKLNSDNIIDNGVFDPKEEMLTSVFKFAAQHLTVESSIHKNGLLLLCYSDLSEILGLQKKERIEELCQEYKLRVKSVTSVPFNEAQIARAVDHDPLINFKNQAKVLLYAITRV